MSVATTQGGGSSSHLPKCCAKASRSKQQCKKHIAGPDTYFCKYHGDYSDEPVAEAVQAVNAWRAAQQLIAATASTATAQTQQPPGQQRPPAAVNYAAIPLPDSPPASEAVLHHNQPSGSAMSVSRMPLPQMVVPPQPQAHVGGYPVTPALSQHGIRFEHGILKVPYKLSAIVALLRDILSRISVQAEFVVLPPSTSRR